MHGRCLKLGSAIGTVINAYNRFRLPHYWGDTKRAAADGTQWNRYENNLLSERHIRMAAMAVLPTITSATMTSRCSRISFRAAFGRRCISSTDDLQREGYPLEPALVAALSPYLTLHIHRFGRYDLDLDKQPPELIYDLWS